MPAMLYFADAAYAAAVRDSAPFAFDAAVIIAYAITIRSHLLMLMPIHILMTAAAFFFALLRYAVMPLPPFRL